MRDFIWTIIIIWVVFKIIALFKGSSGRKTFVYQKQEFRSSQNQQKPEGSVTVEKKSTAGNKNANGTSGDDEYVDFEEIK
jgi:hypothetical protein